eukprot:TRINITY_DN9878_c0_g1_i1.p1 TRINITY_DN9878_c0_g1~~TRINITY_DN9878_c0_g1_i1.p1  ORF type:complete len:386 (-),score=60.56 TRINITY_DN9878_c0_g1_i1:251-1408(-)
MAEGEGRPRWIETAFVVVSWFVLNIMMGCTTKWLFLYGNICKQPSSVKLWGWPDDGETCVQYKYPLAITVVHMVFSWRMCYFHIFVIRGGMKTPPLTLKQQIEKIWPLSVTFALSVAMGNISLKYIYPSFNQMLGSLSPLITVLMAVIVQGKSYNTATWISMPIISGGLLVCSIKETNFHAVGAFFCAGATVLRAAKSIIQGKLLTEKLDSVSLLYYMAPWSALLLAICSFVSEGIMPVVLLVQGFGGVSEGGGYVVALLIVSGANACLLNVANFMVTSHTSAVTLQVLGNLKCCLSILISILIFKNETKPEQAVGVATSLLGVWIYNKYGGTVKASGGAAIPKAGLEMPRVDVEKWKDVVDENERGDDRTGSKNGVAKSENSAV